MKRIVSVILMICIAVSAMSVTAAAAPAYEPRCVEYADALHGLGNLAAGILIIPLTELLRKHIDHELDCTVVPIVHKGGRPYIAGFAPLVFEGRKLGDQVCEEIFQQQSSLMADLTYAAAKHFEGDFPVVIGGGIAAHFPEYLEAIQQKAHPRAHVMLQSAPSVYGAAVEAMWDAGIGIDDQVKANFIADHARLSGDNIFM